MSGTEILLNVFFYVFALGAVGGAVAVALSRNIVRSAFSLLAVLLSVAALYAIMRADFLAGVQVLVYIGGILVLIIFAVMLTHKITDVKLSNESAPGLAPACAVFCLLFSVVLVLLALSRWMNDPWKQGAEEVAVKAGKADLALSQWQADGRTGLARGGRTLEARAVLGVRLAKPVDGAFEAEFEVAAAPGWEKPILRRAALVDGAAKVDVDKLPPTADGKSGLHWRARILGATGEPLSDWTRPASDPAVDFVVYAGQTEPVARALASRHLFAFEAVSVLLLAALVGAAFLARKEVKE
jgi:NADH:ubiquinone oxidoreductase subunit 6 (subunit J)